MKRFFTYLSLLVAIFSLPSKGIAQALLTEDFSYTTPATLVGTNGWVIAGSAATPVLTVTGASLTYTNSPSSGVGSALPMASSGEDATKPFTPALTTGTVYHSFFVNVSAAQATGDYFTGLTTSTNYNSRIFIKSNGTGFSFGISKGNTGTVYETTVRSLNTTYLVVCAYTYNTGTTTDDVVSLWINPALGSATSPTADLTATSTATDATTINAIFARQGASANAPTLVMDGIRVGTTWPDVTPANASCSTPSTAATATAATGITATQFNANWTRGNGSGVIVVVRNTSTAAVAPINGTAYTAGTFGGASTTGTGNYVVYNGTGTTTTVTGLSAGTAYTYDVYEFNSTGNCYATASSQNATTTGSLPACTAPAPVTATTVSGTSGTAVSGTITPVAGADGYVVFYSTTNVAAPALTNATTYSTANAPAGLTFVQTGTATTFSATGLANGTTYYFYVYSYTDNINCSGGPVYAGGYQASGATWGNCIAPAAPSAVTITGTTPSSVSGTITGTAPAFIVFVSSLNTAPTLVNGTSYTAANAPAGYTFIQKGTQTTFTANGLNPTTTYYVYVFGYSSASCLNGPAYSGATSNSGTTTAITAVNHLVISQFYGGGGNSGATYLNDFIEIFNPTTAPVDLTNYSVQYQTASGTTWSVAATLSGTLNPGQYYLVQLGGSTVGIGLPTPDATGTLNMSGSDAKILLANVATAVTSCTDASIVDKIGYGTTASVCNETASASSSGIGNALSFFRASNGCIDTDNNLADFSIATVAPRNTASPLNICTVAPPACAEPTAQSTALTLTPAITSISGSFTVASPAPNKYLVVRSTSSTLSASPVDGTTYTAGQALGGGVVVSYATGTTFTDNGLTANTQYYYFIFAANDASCTGGPNYLTTTPLSGNATTLLPACVAPTAQPTALTLTPAGSSVSGSFTASSPAANKYLVVRSTSSTLSVTPVNGTTYTAGQALGGGIVVQYSAATTFTDNGLTNNTQYYYFVFAANDASCSGGPAYRATTPLTANTTTLLPACVAPTAQPTNLVLAPSSNSVNGSFTASSPAASKYLVVRSTSATLSANPVNGTTYTAGQTIGGGTVVQYIATTTFTDNGLAATTQYYYFVFAANDVACIGGPMYNVTSPLSGNTTTTSVPCVAPTAQATNLVLTSTPTSVSGTFTASSPAANKYLIVRSTSATLSANPVNGTLYSTGQALGGGTVVQYSATTSFTDNALTSNVQYYYFVFAANDVACGGGPMYNSTSPLTANATTPWPACMAPTAQPTALTLTPTITSVSGSFTASAPAANKYLVVRSTSTTLSATPANGTTYTAGQALGGGTVVQYSNTTTFTDNGLTQGTQYYYFVFAANDVNCTGGPLYRTTTPLSGNATTLLPACVEPTNQPTALVLTPSSSNVSGSFTASSPAANKYLVVRSTSATLSAAPVDGTTYTAGQALGGGIVVQYSAATNFTDNGLNSNTTYYYFVFAANDLACAGAPNYKNTTSLSGTTTTPLPACTAPATPTSVTLSTNLNTINGTIVPTTGNYLVVISRSNTLSAAPANGTTYTVGQALGGGFVAAVGSSNTFSIPGMALGSTYYVFVYSLNTGCVGAPFYSTGNANASVTITAINPIPSGYYTNATGLNCQPLKTALKDIIKTNHKTLSYTPGLWNLFPYSDRKRNDANTADVLWDVYSDNPNGPDPYTYDFITNQCGTYTTEGNCYNREHAVPQSWYASALPMTNDAHIVYPVDGYVNGRHGNNPFGKVNTATYTSQNGTKLGTGNNNGYTGTVFEPIDEYKGDFARATLYMITRYEDEIIANNWSANSTADVALLSPTDQPNAAIRRLNILDPWYLQLMIQWHNQDPVSAKEITRNSVIYTQPVDNGTSGTFAQGNRNPFIDHPEYVDMIWNCSTPGAPTFPIDTLITFTGTMPTLTTANLQWTVSPGLYISRFVVERGSTRSNLDSIGNQVRTAVNSYTYNDANVPPSDSVFYRLRIIYGDNSIRYSKILAFDNPNIWYPITPEYGIYPNPASTFIFYRPDVPFATAGLAMLFDNRGRRVASQAINANDQYVRFDINHLANGHYYLSIYSGSGKPKTLHFFKR